MSTAPFEFAGDDERHRLFSEHFATSDSTPTAAYELVTEPADPELTALLSLEDVRSSVELAYDDTEEDTRELATVTMMPVSVEVPEFMHEPVVLESATVAVLPLQPAAEPIKIAPREAVAAKEKVRTRHATPEDLDRIVALDRKMFRSAYGEAIPSVEEVKSMMSQRLANIENGGGWMRVVEVDGEIEGFITGFKTNKPEDKFVSWEDSTADGTLNGKIDPDGDYVYICNLTVGPKAQKHSGTEMLVAQILGEAISDGGVKYGYFESRMPLFRSWLKNELAKEGTRPSDLSEEAMHAKAQKYVDMPEKDKEGNTNRRDRLLTYYEGMGMKKGSLVPGAFKDPASHDYGVVFLAPVPQLRWPINVVAGKLLKMAAKFPRIAAKI